MKIIKSKYKEEVWDDEPGKMRRRDRIEYLVKEGEELIVVCQKLAEADKFVELMKQQNAARARLEGKR